MNIIYICIYARLVPVKYSISYGTYCIIYIIHVQLISKTIKTCILSNKKEKKSILGGEQHKYKKDWPEFAGFYTSMDKSISVYIENYSAMTSCIRIESLYICNVWKCRLIRWVILCKSVLEYKHSRKVDFYNVFKLVACLVYTQNNALNGHRGHRLCRGLSDQAKLNWKNSQVKSFITVFTVLGINTIIIRGFEYITSSIIQVSIDSTLNLLVIGTVLGKHYSDLLVR